MNTSLASTDSPNATDTTTPMTYLAQQPIPSSYAVNDGSWSNATRTLRGAIARVARSLRSVGPYVAIELILPGGSLIALALWTYRHRRAAQLDNVAPCTQR